MENIGELRALANPTRLRIISLLSGGALSAADVARRLDIAHGSASFHLRQLAGAGVVRLVREREHRGGRERLYEFQRQALDGLTPDSTGALERAVLTELRRRLALPRGEGSQLTSTAEIWAEPADWESTIAEIAGILQRLADRSSRIPRPGQVHGSLVAMMFPIAGETAS
ncbi:MAG: ArsR/SmtB family transcription factor [Candidatus Dormibacteria bacterium]